MNSLEKLSEYLAQAILLEVTTAPKPGLVTRHSNGAHGDMSILTFAMSSVIVSKAFSDLFIIGSRHKGNIKELLNTVRTYGIDAEKELLKSTKGVNTQRGILFAGGLVSAAGGYLSQQNVNKDVVNSICNTVSNMTEGIVQKELVLLNNENATTAGEKLYEKYGITGIRGEVEKGFPSVKFKGIPALKEAFQKGVCMNDAFIHTLISLMTVVEDSNVIWRGDFNALIEVKKRACEILEKGSIFTSIGRSAIETFDYDCIEHHISPGGSADLLSISIALYLLENKTFPINIM